MGALAGRRRSRTRPVVFDLDAQPMARRTRGAPTAGAARHGGWRSGAPRESASVRLPSVSLPSATGSPSTWTRMSIPDSRLTRCASCETAGTSRSPFGEPRRRFHTASRASSTAARTSDRARSSSSPLRVGEISCAWEAASSSVDTPTHPWIKRVVHLAREPVALVEHGGELPADAAHMQPVRAPRRGGSRQHAEREEPAASGRSADAA